MEHFTALDQLATIELIKGGFAGMLQTANMSIAFTDMKAGAEVPLHQHPEEAVDIILEGELFMRIGEEEVIMKRGIISTVASNIPHQAKAITDCKVVTVFHPARKM